MTESRDQQFFDALNNTGRDEDDEAHADAPDAAGPGDTPPPASPAIRSHDLLRMGRRATRRAAGTTSIHPSARAAVGATPRDDGLQPAAAVAEQRAGNRRRVTFAT